MSSFSIALSGLTASSSDLDITANNIANADTVGFKESRAEFADVYASGAVNLNTSVTGEGVRLASTAQQFTQGNISKSTIFKYAHSSLGRSAGQDLAAANC